MKTTTATDYAMILDFQLLGQNITLNSTL